MKSISFIPYLVLNLGKSGVQRFKRYTNRNWNEEVMAVWRRPHKAERKFHSRDPISQVVSQLRNHPLAHECHFAAPSPHFAAAKWAAKMPLLCEIDPPLRTMLWNHLQATNQVANHLQVAESPPSCKTKVQTCKMDNSTCESTCAIHLCNLRYLPSTKLDFFSQDNLCKFLFSLCNQSKILLGYFLENILRKKI